MDFNHKLSKYEYKFNNSEELDKKVIYLRKIGQYLNQKGSGILDGEIKELDEKYRQLLTDIEKKLGKLAEIKERIEHHEDIMGEIFSNDIKYNSAQNTNKDIVSYYENLCKQTG
jgi:hypothetical protein